MSNDEGEQRSILEDLEALRRRHEALDLQTKENADRVINNEMILHDVHTRVKSIETTHEEVGDYKTFMTDVKELVEILKNLRHFFIVLGWIGKVAKWLAAMSLAYSLFVAAFKRIL